jgi:LEA14-like dessication related protein
MEISVIRNIGLSAVASLATACASNGLVVQKPDVSLRHVELSAIDLDSQTFVLDFEVRNPNPFPLPVDSIAYGLKLDGFRFASGETVSDFVVPAGSDGHFEITVDTDLMRTAPQLLFIVRDGVYRDIPYALEGRFAIGVPLANPVSFRNEGSIRLSVSELAADRSD